MDSGMGLVVQWVDRDEGIGVVGGCNCLYTSLPYPPNSHEKVGFVPESTDTQ